MPGIEQLNKALSDFQYAGINCGGIWTVRLFPKTPLNHSALLVLVSEFKQSPLYDNEELYLEFEQKGGWNPEKSMQTANLHLIELSNGLDSFVERLDHWSEFELISEKEMREHFQQSVYDFEKQRFLTELQQFLNERKLEGIFKIDENKFDTSFWWKEHIPEDFVFDLENEILVISLGWSS